MKYAIISLSSLLFLPLAARAQVAPAIPYATVDICDISHHPGKFVGKRILFRAEVLADGMHGALLLNHDESCVVHFATPSKHPSAAEEEAGRTFETAIFQGSPGTINKSIEGDFGGLLTMEIPSFGPGKKRLPALRLELIHQLKITELPNPSKP